MERPWDVLFVLGEDYHLGDLLWFTIVVAQFRRQRRPRRVLVSVPDRPISAILDHNPLIDVLLRGEEARAGALREEAPTGYDLRPFALGIEIVRRWHQRAPWLYWRDLWLEPRGQWLATYLGLGTLDAGPPTLRLTPDDFAHLPQLPDRYVLLAPHIGAYRFPPFRALWRSLKGWPMANWIDLAGRIREMGYEPVTLAAAGQSPVPGTHALLGLPIRTVAAVVARAGALVSGESGLWFIAAAVDTPFIIVPWWLPRSVDWAAPMGVPYRIVPRAQAQVGHVANGLANLLSQRTEGRSS